MIGYYIHHHGQGHLARASSVAAASDEPVIALSSLPEPLTHPFAAWLALPPDPASISADAPDAGGALHWAPLDSAGYRDRMAAISRWVARERPRLVVVDVSVEVAGLIRLLAVPVAVVALPGRRIDPPHLLAFRMASRVIAPWPRLGPALESLDALGSSVVWTGAFSRFDDRPVAPPPGDGRVLVLLGSGGVAAEVARLAELAPDAGWTWHSLGGEGRWVDDPWPDLLGTDVVVTHAGLNALAEVAASRRPAVVLPQDRPFGEQRETAARLTRAGLAEVLDRPPVDYDWSDVLARAVRRGGNRWTQWNAGDGAARFVDALADIPTVRRVA